jgi:PAS domain S-box-containing protein
LSGESLLSTIYRAFPVVALHRLTYSNGIPENYILLDVNRRFEEILGVSRDRVVNKPATEVYGSADAPYLKEYAAVVETGTPFQFQTYFSPMDKHFSISVAPMGDDLFATIFFEITKQKKTEEALQQANEAVVKAERHYRHIFNSVSDAVFVHGLGDDGLPGRFIEVNDIACRRLGYTRDELLQLRPLDIDAPDTVAGIPAVMKRLQADGYAVWEGIHVAKDGRRIPVEISNRVFEFDGSPTIISSVRDVTERKQAEAAQAKLEEQLRQAQKLESIGRLAGGVAHDFNNLLTVINGYADFLLADLDPTDPLWSSADEIRKAGERAASLTKQLLAFSRKQIIEPKALDLNTTIRDSERMLQRLIGEDVMLTTTLDTSLGRVMADPEQVHQVIMNLVVNARDAMPDGGRLEISTANVDVTERDADIQQDAKPGPHVMVMVTDTGTGMDERTRQHIFEPFFTTKKGDKGTGLGLSTVYGIMRQNGGWICVSSDPGKGTSFKLYFPRIDGNVVVEQGETARSPGANGGETILVVEDQEAVRRLTVAMLKLCGYQILEAAEAGEALDVAQRHSGEIHLLLTDVVLPGINGKELSERLRILRPKLKVLFTSGYTAEIIGHRGVLGHGLAYIPKPFGPDTLAAKVREVLGEPATAQ